MKTIFPTISIEPGLFEKVPQKVRSLGNSFAIITDSNLKNLGERLLASMRKAGLTCNLLVIPASETAKSLTMIGKLAESLMKIGAKRDSCLIGLGGGVVGDISGFLASIFMRGVAYVSIPTTLLSMGDSSIGGKTGVDMDAGKNLLGTFYHPKLILMDPNMLKDLPRRAFVCGLAEIVKHGVIADLKLFNYLEKNVIGILAKRPAILKHIISASVKVKMSIVKKDEKESIQKVSGRIKGGVSRMLVNYGHTVGHALEKVSQYQIPHGEAVSIGMVSENRVAVGKKLLKEKDAIRIKKLLSAFHLPTKIPTEYSSAAIKKAMSSDKKNIGGSIYFALPTKIGKARIIKV